MRVGRYGDRLERNHLIRAKKLLGLDFERLIRHGREPVPIEEGGKPGESRARLDVPEWVGEVVAFFNIDEPGASLDVEKTGALMPWMFRTLLRDEELRLAVDTAFRLDWSGGVLMLKEIYAKGEDLWWRARLSPFKDIDGASAEAELGR
jgi:hypothetical protein